VSGNDGEVVLVKGNQLAWGHAGQSRIAGPTVQSWISR